MTAKSEVLGESSDAEDLVAGKAPTIFALVKLVEKPEHAEQFRRGELYMNSVRHFRGHRDENGAMRADPDESLCAIWQPDQIRMQLGGVDLPTDGLVGPVKMTREIVKSWHLFCMFSANTLGLGEGVSVETLPMVKEAFSVGDKCAKLGTIAVVVHPKQFVERVYETLDRLALPGDANAGLVRYYDMKTFHGTFEPKYAVLRKSNIYSHQREWRVALHPPIASAVEPFIMDIGDIRDFSWTTTVEELNKSIELRLPADNEAA